MKATHILQIRSYHTAKLHLTGLRTDPLHGSRVLAHFVSAIIRTHDASRLLILSPLRLIRDMMHSSRSDAWGTLFLFTKRLLTCTAHFINQRFSFCISSSEIAFSSLIESKYA